jgi:hypothetical protein
MAIMTSWKQEVVTFWTPLSSSVATPIQRSIDVQYQLSPFCSTALSGEATDGNFTAVVDATTPSYKAKG